MLLVSLPLGLRLAYSESVSCTCVDQLKHFILQNASLFLVSVWLQTFPAFKLAAPLI